MDDRELTSRERAALDAWAPLAPPPGFAERVLAQRPSSTTRRRRWPTIAAALVACAAATAIFVATPPEDRSAHGELVATVRTTRTLGDRAVAVAEPHATLTWRIDDDGGAVVEQRAGDVFYRVDRGGPFVVHTPVGDVHVTGTCFRIEVEPMNKTTQLLLSGTVGAALAAGIVVTVYEGRVVADTGSARTELVAGNRATIGADGRTLVDSAGSSTAPAIAAGATLDERNATREELLARTASQRTELARLRERVAELERLRSAIPDNGAETGRAWYDPSPERLKAWAAECHVRSDEPGLGSWRPATALGRNDLGLEPDELADYNAAFSEVQTRWFALVRELYIEATGDTAGVETLSIDAMRGEIQQKSAPEELGYLLQRIANERAGLAQAPADLSQASPFERMMRNYISLGDQVEQALATRLGPERAKELRGDGWGSRSDWSGCPSTAQ